MKTVISGRLVRFTAHPEHGSFSSLSLEGWPVCNMLEPYFRWNTIGKSCIPENIYVLKRVFSPTWNCYTFEITDVEGRTLIRWHPGNTDDDTRGCMIPGSEFGNIGDDWGVLESRKAFIKLMNALDGVDEIILTVVNCY